MARATSHPLQPALNYCLLTCCRGCNARCTETKCSTHSAATSMHEACGEMKRCTIATPLSAQNRYCQHVHKQQHCSRGSAATIHNATCPAALLQVVIAQHSVHRHGATHVRVGIQHKHEQRSIRTRWAADLVWTQKHRVLRVSWGGVRRQVEQEVGVTLLLCSLQLVAFLHKQS